ncbi:hypothetical protein [Hymenobacter sp. PAMC 26628]|uniref:hypothetical protein n=1 Tax=Hymenobacter sp. PAMC 26628 TaxID=1484118 RepID=UPI00076FE1B9|nr:hypothetical protein [Hymenobacter sp. PAMC 26628]AMJ64850.1 hypothetical protein AXW84_04960 [Hymenobacter sp. PAMC 26628]
MKISFFSAFGAIALLASTSAFAAPAPAANHDRDDHRPAQGPGNRYDDRNSKDFNYGYDRKHRVTPQEEPAGRAPTATTAAMTTGAPPWRWYRPSSRPAGKPSAATTTATPRTTA